MSSKLLATLNGKEYHKGKNVQALLGLLPTAQMEALTGQPAAPPVCSTLWQTFR